LRARVSSIIGVKWFLFVFLPFMLVFRLFDLVFHGNGLNPGVNIICFWLIKNVRRLIWSRFIGSRLL